jgi:hypothetical protein
MDTSILAYTAEDLISHKLMRGKILVAKPKFDQRSTDLLGLLQVGDGVKFCRIQCKGRTLINGKCAPVKLFADDVTDALVVFLFVETGDPDETCLFAFFASEIRKTWDLGESNGRPIYRLQVTKPRIDGELTPYQFSESRLVLIKRLIEQAETAGEFAALKFTAEVDVTVPGARCNVPQGSNSAAWISFTSSALS